MKKSLLILAALFCSTTLLFAQDARVVVNEIAFTTESGNFDAQFSIGGTYSYYDVGTSLLAPEAPYHVEYWNGYLYKWDEEKNDWDWNGVSSGSVLAAGKYLYEIRVRIDGDAGLTHRLPESEEELSVTVDGNAWEIYSGSLLVADELSQVYIKHEFTLAADPTALDNANANAQAVKRIVNGMLLIERGDRTYTLTGQAVK